jgi:cytochrome c oxidase subunit 3
MSARGVSVVDQAAIGAPSQRVYVTGMAVALCGVLLFFASLLSAWVVRKGLAGAPELPLDLPAQLLGTNAFVLIFSSALLERARRRLAAGDERGFRASWYSSVAVGGVFLVGQAIAWREMAARGVFLASSPNASFFYLLTYAHAVHLLGGLAGLIAVVWWPLRRMRLATAVRVAAMYWHFLTAIWTCIFVLLMV